MTDDQVAAEVRARLTAAENGIPVPPDLKERVLTAAPARVEQRPRRWSTLVVAAAAVLGVVGGAAVATAVFRTGDTDTPVAGTDVAVTVFNAEAPCRPLRTLECSLGVLKDPYRPAPDQVVDRVWHGDTITALCVVADGKRVSDETGVSSTRWYRVRTTDGVVGYLPGVRTRNTVEIQLCPGDR
jgi:hypothetical protein